MDARMKRAFRRPKVRSAVLVLTAIGAVLAAAAIGVPASRTGEATSPGANGKIAFTSGRDRTFEIYSMNPNGSGLTNVSNNDSPPDTEADWSPDGTKIAFTSSRDGDEDIFVMNADGSNVIEVTVDTPGPSDTQPAWSPDGTKIAFVSQRDGNQEVYVMNANGSNQTRLTNNPAVDENPSWSPTGAQIAFVSQRDGNDEVYVMNSDGSSPTNLTNNPTADDSPDWSPNGEKIAFSTSRDGNGEVYVMNADGSNPVNLTNQPAPDDEVRPSWSPDGTQIAFDTDRDGNFEIYVMNADGSGQTNVSNNSASFLDIDPDWGPQPPMEGPPGDPTCFDGIDNDGDRFADGEDSDCLPAFTVDTTSDADLTACTAAAADCSLRGAITRANAQAGKDAIKFNITSGCDAITGVCTISPATALPNIIQALIIDGFSQPGASANTNGLHDPQGSNAVLKIRLSGTGRVMIGLRITGGGSTVRGLVINRFAFGIYLSSSGNFVRGNYIGVNPEGNLETLSGNGDGVRVTGAGNTIGGLTPGDRNVISGNGGNGFDAGVSTGTSTSANNTTVQGNYIGINAAGSDDAGNYNGIFLNTIQNRVGGTDEEAGNVISGNNLGVYANGSGDTIQGNYVGLDVTGTKPIGNASGIYVRGATGRPSTVGGTTEGARNVISGNDNGVAVQFGSLIQGNYIGTDVTGRVTDPDGIPGNGDDLGNASVGLNLGGAAIAWVGRLWPPARLVGAPGMLSQAMGQGWTLRGCKTL